jgi:hypothetical protein
VDLLFTSRFVWIHYTKQKKQERNGEKTRRGEKKKREEINANN